MAQTPSIPKGTRDYSPEIMVKRNYIFDTIKGVFKLYGYMPLETPAMENLSTLMGKYGSVISLMQNYWKEIALSLPTKFRKKDCAMI